ncbi:MAG: glycosyltransferase, partial [Selenomonadaceae bacterium]|nr:glycosyltransferase [Selenomonadaceae bacterium]
NRFYSKDIHEILLREFSQRGDLSASTVPFFFSTIANRDKTIRKTQNNLDKLTVEAEQQQKKIDSLEKHIRPIISIIIPMYNAERFIGELLDSLLAQTLENFEVIIVDDCSKDSSYEVVKEYIPKFDGRLKLLQMEKNSGAAPAPRNKGFLYSRGDYIFFMDADDAFTKTALEEMYTLAKDYDADVVYCEKYYMSTGSGQEFMDNIYPADSSIQLGGFVETPTFISEDLADRLRELAQKRFWVTPWQRLVKRELLAENKIVFPEIIGSDDVVWCFQVLCCAKKFLRVPNSCYIRRMYDESFTKSKKAPNKHIRQWSDVVIRGLNFVSKFMDGLKFFNDNPNHRYEALNILSRSCFGPIAPVCADLKDEEIYDIFLKEFAKDTGANDALISFLCTRVVEEDKVFKKDQREIKRLNEELKKAQNRTAERDREISRLEKEIGILKSMKESLPLPALPAASSKFSALAVSVVIPMYNAEEFIGECLNSLLLQTLQNFEVIVADDCSTDRSVKIVESYAKKFNGRLRLTSTKKNSGGGGYIPRNLGLTLANGEYVIFLDADDFLLGTALETLYNAAKEYEADVVYSSTYYNVVEPNDVYIYRDGLGRKMFKEGVEDTIALTVDDTDKIFKEFLASSEGNFRAPWSKFVRRDFLLQNEIRFPDIVTGGDCIWCINVYAYSKRFLRLPTPLYFYRRYNGTSITRTTRTPKEQLSYWVSAFIAFLKALNDLQSRTQVLRDNPNYCYEATRGGHFEWCLNRTHEARKELSNQEVYEVLYREMGKEKDLFETAVPFFFAVIDNEKKNREEKLQTIKGLREEVRQLKKAKK